MTANKKRIKVPPVYKRNWIIPNIVDPIDIKTNDIRKRVTPKKNVVLIILALKEHIKADKTARAENIITRELIIICYPLL